MTERIVNRWDLEAILNRELHRFSQCASCRFVGLAEWNGEGSIFDHITVDAGGLPEDSYRDIVEKIIAEARCTYEDAFVV